MKIKKVMTGAEASAEAMKQIDPDVAAVYPITPQTPVMHAFAQFVADGDVSTELVLVESEHSAMSCVVGASAAGARAMTATSSNGLALMHEIVYIAASTRLPIVMNVVNRALSGPINIHCDHSDTMAERDSGWLQFYCETAQEVYELTILAIRLSEHPLVKLPIMVCQDGFISSHCYQNIEIISKKETQKFIGEYKPKHYLLDVKNPFTVGPLDLDDYYFEHKRQQSEGIKNAKKVFKEISKEFSNYIGRKYDYVETYRMKDADYVIVTMSSTAGTVKSVVDVLRKKGKKVGLLKIIMFRPFPVDDIIKFLEGKKAVAVLDRAESFGALGAPLFNDIRSALYEVKKKPTIVNYIFGLGGRGIGVENIADIYNEIEKLAGKDVKDRVKYLGVR